MAKEKSVKSVVLSLRLKPESRNRLDDLVVILGNQFWTTVSRVQAFNVAVQEALERRKPAKQGREM